MLLRFDIVAGLYNSYKKVPKYPLGSGYHEEKRPYYKVSFQGPTLFDRELGYHINKKTRKSNLHSVIINDQLFMPIRKISKILYEGKVCNLEVKEDHSYIIENISAHNCITALEAQLSETIIVCSDLAGLKTTVADRGILISGEGDTPAYTEAYQKRALQEVFAILRDDERRKMMTAKAKEWAVQQTWANRAKEWLGIFGLMPPIK